MAHSAWFKGTDKNSRAVPKSPPHSFFKTSFNSLPYSFLYLREILTRASASWVARAFMRRLYTMIGVMWASRTTPVERYSCCFFFYLSLVSKPLQAPWISLQASSTSGPSALGEMSPLWMMLGYRLRVIVQKKGSLLKCGSKGTDSDIVWCVTWCVTSALSPLVQTTKRSRF